MRVAFIALSCVLIAGCTVANYAIQNKPAPNGQRTPVLVEVFTSEGCSSCPPVDKLVADLQQRQPVANAQVVLLSFHVDYWNELGWKDRFASHEYTQRQEQYSALFSEPQVYTPEVLVDGKESRAEWLAQEVRNAAAAPTDVAFRIAPKSPQAVEISAQGSVKAPAHVLVAITEDGLSTKVGGGENGGHTLMHSGVVRRLASLGKLDKGAFSKEFPLALDPQWQTSKLTLVCFAQDEKTGKVLGVSAQPVETLFKTQK